MYAQIAVDIPLFKSLTYRVPAHLRDVLAPGHLVQVPFRNRAKTGLVLEVQAELDDPELESKLKDIVDLVDAEPLLTETGTRFLEFIAEYYLAPIGEVVKLALPSFVRLEGMKHYELVEGTDASELDDDLAAAVAYLQKNDKSAVSDIKDALKDTTFTRLRELEALDLVDVTYEEKSGSVRVKTERFYKIVREPDDGDRIGTKQARILEMLDTEAGTSLTEIRERISSPYSSLSGLEDRGFIEVREEEVYRDPFAREPVKEPEHHELTRAQQGALMAIKSARGEFEGFVLHGVTGSGKTEVYVHAIRDAIAHGERALVLLPEIALTPQFVAVFRGHFGEQIAVLHSGLTPAEKFDEWRRIKRNEVDIVIGARSALFAPLEKLGVLVVDEEHDPSFKQEQGPRYNARDMALLRGKLENARVILGSATPSLESYHNSHNGRLTYLEMPDRVADRPMPDVEIIDLRDRETHSDGPSEILSDRLFQALQKTLSEQMQAILFLNRRGFSPCVICQSCGHVFKCINCDVSLTYHRSQESLRCHHCDYSIRMPESCPECNHRGISRKGAGTEKLADHIAELFPRANIARLDRDTSGGKRLQKTIKAFRRGEIDLLVGTQMVTKGHDFPSVITVGVVMADLSLNFPDFRSSERTFQLLTQVAGRAGRGNDPGHVYTQTYNPEHFSLQTAQEHDYEAFAERELQLREKLGYPPHGHLIALKFEARSESRCMQAARDYASSARRVLRKDEQLSKNVFMLGPAMAPLARLKGKSRWQILLKSRSRKLLRKLAIATLNGVAHFDVAKSPYRNVRIIVDVDPINML